MRAVRIEKYEKSPRYHTYVAVYKTEGNKDEFCNLAVIFRRCIVNVMKRSEGVQFSYKGSEINLKTPSLSIKASSEIWSSTLTGIIIVKLNANAVSGYERLVETSYRLVVGTIITVMNWRKSVAR